MTSHPFRIHVPDAAVDDLRRRLEAARWPEVLDADGWADGTSLAFMRRLVDRWLHGFDWRAQEATLNRLPHRTMTVAGQAIHFVHRPGAGPSPMPLVVTHGWPGSFVEMVRLIPRLADPGAHGGDPADAFHVVVPSLPGYAFSPAPMRPGTNTGIIATLWHGLMTGLGYDRYGAQGGDIGAGVSTWLARLFPDHVTGIHLNYVPASYRPSLDGAPEPTAEERAFFDTVASWSAAEGAYAALQGTKPQTLAYALCDTPLGLAAWMAEKMHAWSEDADDSRSLAALDLMLVNISLHWFSGNAAAAARLYKENRLRPLTFGRGERVSPPLGVAVFPGELPMPPRSWVERVFDVRRWTTMPAGGHFAALEQPDLLAAEIRAHFRPLRARNA